MVCGDTQSHPRKAQCPLASGRTGQGGAWVPAYAKQGEFLRTPGWSWTLEGVGPGPRTVWESSLPTPRVCLCFASLTFSPESVSPATGDVFTTVYLLSRT